MVFKYLFGYHSITLVDLKGRKERFVLEDIKEEIFIKDSKGDETYEYIYFLIQKICKKGIHPEIDADFVAREIVNRALKSEEEKLHDWEIVANLNPSELIEFASEIFCSRNQTEILENILDKFPEKNAPSCVP